MTIDRSTVNRPALAPPDTARGAPARATPKGGRRRGVTIKNNVIPAEARIDGGRTLPAPRADSPLAGDNARASAAAGKRAASSRGPHAVFAARATNADDRLDELGRGVVSAIETHLDYLLAHPKHLAWAMMHHQLIVRSADRILGNASAELRSAIEDLADRHPEHYATIIDAWAAAYGEDDHFTDLAREHAGFTKPNKSFDEWVSALTDHSYRYSSLYWNAGMVAAELLGGFANKVAWNKDGFVDRVLRCRTSDITFAGYTMCADEIDSTVRAAITAPCADALVAPHIQSILAADAALTAENPAERNVRRHMDELERACDKDKRSSDYRGKAVNAMRRAAYIEQLVEEARRWTPEQWAAAQNSPEWVCGGVRFDVSTVAWDECSKAAEVCLNVGSRARDITESPWKRVFADEAPADGWDAIAGMVKRKGPFNLGDFKTATYEAGSDSLLATMPDNADESYKKAGRAMARAILELPSESKTSKRIANEFLAKWGDGA